MDARSLRRTLILPVGLLVGLLLAIVAAGPATAQLSRQLVITNVDASSAPTIEVTLYGLAGGAPIDFSTTPIVVQQDGEVIPSDSVEIVPDAASVGTLTIFLVDLPPGVADSIPTIQEQITSYASPEHMQELVDYTAVYRVGAAGATRLLEATEFHNSVANLFTTGTLETEPGVTALYDSVLGLLDGIEATKPSPELLPVMVVISDGTDAVSTAEGLEVPRRAAELGIPVHTIWLDNANLAEDEEGQDYLSVLAGQTGGVAARLDDPESVNQIWNAIDQRGRQSVIRYTASEVSGGEHTVTISLESDPATFAETTFTMPPEAPTIVLNVPAASRTLTLPSLDEPVENVRLSTEVSWLDGVEREIVQAQLVVNGVMVSELEPGNLDSFDPLISSEYNYVFGENRVQVWIEDEAGGRARSGEIILTIEEGEETQIPEEIQSGFFDQLGGFLPWLLGCLGTVILVIILFGALYLMRRSSLLRSLGLSNLLYRIPFLKPYLSEVRQAEQAARSAKYMKGRADRVKDAFSRYDSGVRGSTDTPGGGTGQPPAYFEVLKAQSNVSGRIDLTGVEIHLGRSPKQADIVFPDDITVSRLHATIVQEGIDYRIFDEQSTSGTFVNEQRVPDYGIQLIDRDEVRLGGVLLRFRQP